MKSNFYSKIVLGLVVIFLNHEVHAKDHVIPLSANRVSRFSQGLLDAHIQAKIKSGKDFKTLEFCFLKVDTEEGDTIEFFNKRCPTKDDLAKFRKNEPILNVFALSPILKTTAEKEWLALKNEYAAQIDKIDINEVRALDVDVKNDSLGQLVYMELNGKKVNVGYIDAENRLMDLCSASWANICYYDGQAFRLGNETRVEYSEENHPDYAWDWPRSYIDFEELLAGAVFTRGNDDSRGQAVYYLTIPKSGRKVPITEEWYLYFHLNPKLRHLVEKSQSHEGKAEVTHRTRREWNYLTAIHPIHVFRTRNRQSGEIGIRMYMGAAVIYDSALEIEDSNCDVAESEGFLFVSSESLLNKTPILNGEILTTFERGFLIANFENLWDQAKGVFNKAAQARYFNDFNDEGTGRTERDQEKYLPELETFDGVKIFGMNSDVELSSDAFHQSFVIFKSADSYMVTDPELDPSSPEATFLSSLNNYHMVKEYLNLEKVSDSRFNISLVGFNPNELVANNPKRFDLERGKYTVSYDPEAIFPVWSSSSDKTTPSHVVSRPLSIRLQKIKFALNKAYYDSQRTDGTPPRDNLFLVSTAIENGENVTEEERDIYLRGLDSKARFVSKNMWTPYAVKGRFTLLTDLFDYVNIMYVEEMYDENWFFPNFYLIQRYIEATNPAEEGKNELQLVEVKRDLLDYFKNYAINFKGLEYAGDIILRDHQNISNNLEINENFVSHYIQEKQVLTDITEAIGDIYRHSIEGYFLIFKSFNQDVFEPLAKANKSQLKALGKVLPELLTPYGVYRQKELVAIDRKKLYFSINECFVNANADIEKHIACEALSRTLKNDLQNALSKVGI